MAAGAFPRRDSDDRALLAALLVSFLLHLSALLLLNRSESPPPSERLIEVSLQAPPEVKPQIEELKQVLPKEQFVTPPELPEAKVRPETRFKSEKNTVTEREQIKRGDGASRKSAPSLPTPQENGGKSNPLNLKLKLSDSTLREIAENTPAQKPEGLRSLTEYRPFQGNQTEELFRIQPGSPDYLPGIPDGEMTLLNAKADRFAPFVRRVAQQVFGLVRKFQWHTIPAHEVRRIGDFVSVEAVMSRSGTLLSVRVLEPSGSPSFDRLITRSVQEGANDQNPPVAAVAEDGNIHFVFRSRCWSRPGGGGSVESRWLLLATGLL